MPIPVFRLNLAFARCLCFSGRISVIIALSLCSLSLCLFLSRPVCILPLAASSVDGMQWQETFVKCQSFYWKPEAAHSFQFKAMMKLWPPATDGATLTATANSSAKDGGQAQMLERAKFKSKAQMQLVAVDVAPISRRSQLAGCDVIQDETPLNSAYNAVLPARLTSN